MDGLYTIWLSKGGWYEINNMGNILELVSNSLRWSTDGHQRILGIIAAKVSDLDDEELHDIDRTRQLILKSHINLCKSSKMTLFCYVLQQYSLVRQDKLK